MQFIADSDQSMQKKCCLATYQPKMNVRGKRNEEKKKKKGRNKGERRKGYPLQKCKKQINILTLQITLSKWISM